MTAAKRPILIAIVIKKSVYAKSCLYNLLYFVIKNHPFTDGNKRIGAFLFVWFLEKNKHRFKKNGEVKINDNGLTALALLIAQSDPNDKELMIKLVLNLINSR